MKVLIVDDTMFTRMIIARKLDKFDCKVIEAADGNDAISKACSEKPDVIIMDINMPLMSGIEATKEILKKIETKIIICSCLSKRNLVIEAVKAGAIDYIVKPIEDGRIEQAIKRFQET